MFNVGGGEFMLIALVALLVLGPDKLPDFARKSARVIGQLRSMSQGFQNEMKSVINVDEMKDLMNEGTGTPQMSRGPRLVGPIDTGDGPADEATISADTVSTDGGGAPAPAPSESSTASTPDPSSAPPTNGADPGSDGNASGTSAA